MILLERETRFRRIPSEGKEGKGGEERRRETLRGIMENIPFVNHPCPGRGIRGRAAWDSSKGRSRYEEGGGRFIPLPYGKKFVYSGINRRGRRREKAADARSFFFFFYRATNRFFEIDPFLFFFFFERESVGHN